MNAVDLHTWLRSRHSVRSFEPTPVSEDVLRRILETGIHAPNAHNRQAWRFVVLTGETDRLRLADCMAADFRSALEVEGEDETVIAQKIKKTSIRLQTAPVVVLLFSVAALMDFVQDNSRLAGEAQMAAQSVVLAGGQMLLAAHVEGLGGVWVCWPLFTQRAITHAFDLPAEWQAQGMLLLGHPKGDPQIRERLPLDDVVTFL